MSKVINLMSSSLDLLNSRILIVDDKDTNRILFEKILRKIGYSNIEMVSNGQDAIDLHVNGKSYDLILLDLQMPIMNGFDFMINAKKFYDEGWMPVVVSTAFTEEKNRQVAAQYGAKDFIHKPVSEVADFTIRIRNTLQMVKMYKKLKEKTEELSNSNEQLKEKVTEKVREAEVAWFEIFERLSKAAEFRDNETGQHVKRIGKIAKILAQELTGDSLFADLIELAAPMHDIGKLGIPDDVLLKPGSLTAEEWNVMKKHTTIGADILETSSTYSHPSLKLAKEIALSHHEKWDGSGYPNGLSGSDIPLSARIVAVADVFDALRSSRPYKPVPWSVSDTLAYIKKVSGSHLCPEVVNCFFDNFEKIEKSLAGMRD